MTCREKLAIEHPECVGQNSIGGADQCPHSYGYTSPPVYCPYNNLGKANDDVCGRCWDREIPEEGRAVNLYHNDQIVETMLVEKPRILDSGNRTVFESGAVRDIQEGKGRCDLLPLDVVSFYYAHDEDLSDQDSPQTWVFYHLSRFVLDGQIEHLRQALRKSRIFEDAETMFLETAIHYEEGAKKYDENNWKKGIPVKRYIDSAVRHYLKFLRGDTDERHDRAFCWNIMGAIWTCKHMPELNEYRKVEVP